MTGKVVLITGANGGLGTHVTRAFLEAGANVVGVSSKIDTSEFNHTNFVALPKKVSSGEDARYVIEQALSHLGRLDILVHTVGGFAGGSSVADTDDTTFQSMFDMNVNSLFYLLRAAVPALRKINDGRIIAIGSRAAVEPGANVGAYSASKAAMLSLMKTVAIENKDAGIRANVILPGTMDTAANRKAMPKADFSKWVRPEAVASLIVWLAGDAAKDVNGAAIPIYGGDF
jgi:NAD(P)-dependent dehydrogenase (short-subunit alcohol dehydrogenase family)